MNLRDLLTPTLVGELDRIFNVYGGAIARDHDHIASSAYHQLIGILIALQSATGEDTIKVMKIMTECTNETTLPHMFHVAKTAP